MIDGSILMKGGNLRKNNFFFLLYRLFRYFLFQKEEREKKNRLTMKVFPKRKLIDHGEFWAFSAFTYFVPLFLPYIVCVSL